MEANLLFCLRISIAVAPLLYAHLESNFAQKLSKIPRLLRDLADAVTALVGMC